MCALVQHDRRNLPSDGEVVAASLDTDRTALTVSPLRRVADRPRQPRTHKYPYCKGLDMVSVTEFIVQLLTSVVDLVRIFLFDVVGGGDPLSIFAFVSGSIFVGISVAFFGYLVLGAVAELFGGAISFEAGKPPQQE
ncbi:hypothetical protein SAMN04487948_10866 [Halogranum amylolyticum]|uniref:Uncharacterized protein n=1 Tax=Halogranum amylolyticum TaxID=660520 RepID=A0A1H8TS61_9EURY|nr:hypothetical protein [Halogranum amylolyticum]SEO93474.1 hypothetical protein SAMN04487948_10866 [Halogranum amylolyticum]